jgi:hypothetical protein
LALGYGSFIDPRAAVNETPHKFLENSCGILYIVALAWTACAQERNEDATSGFWSGW